MDKSAVMVHREILNIWEDGHLDATHSPLDCFLNASNED
jgi:hypothetical protein